MKKKPYRMGENIYKQHNWEGVNFQNTLIQTLHIPKDNVQGFPFLHILSNIY